MSNSKLQAARELIQEKKYEIAKAILETMPNEPTAQLWLTKLSEMLVKPTEMVVSNISEATNKWRVEKTESPFDDSITVMLSCDADAPVMAMVRHVLPSLTIRCKEGSLSVFIYFDTPLSNDDGIDGVAKIRLRYVKERPQELFLGESTTGEAIFFPDARKTIEKLLLHQRLALEFTPYGASPGIAIFTLDGLRDAIVEIPRQCW